MAKKAALLLIMCLLTGAAIGCGMGSGSSGKGQEASYSARQPDEYDGEITVWTWSGDWTKEYIKLFNKTYPNIKVKMVEYSYDNYYTKLYNSIQGGSGAPDVIEIEEGQIAALIDSGQLEDLSQPPYNADKSLFFPNIAEIFTNGKGEFVGLPEAANPSGIWYNRKVAKQFLGTDDPEEMKKMIGSGEESYDKFVESMEKVVTESGGKVKGVGSLKDVLQMLQFQKGNKIFEDKKIVYEDTYKDSYQLLETIARKDLSAGLNPFETPWMETFNNDTVAFYPGAVWYEGYTIPKKPEHEGKWGFIPSPGPGWSWGDQASAIWSKSKNKELAWVWVKWFCTSTEAQLLQYKVGSIPPGVKNAFDLPELHEVDPITKQKIGEIFAEIFAKAVPKVHTTNDAAVNAATTQALKELEEKKIDGNQALKKVVDDALKRLKGFSR